MECVGLHYTFVPIFDIHCQTLLSDLVVGSQSSHRPRIASFGQHVEIIFNRDAGDAVDARSSTAVWYECKL